VTRFAREAAFPLSVSLNSSPYQIFRRVLFAFALIFSMFLVFPDWPRWGLLVSAIILKFILDSGRCSPLQVKLTPLFLRHPPACFSTRSLVVLFSMLPRIVPPDNVSPAPHIDNPPSLLFLWAMILERLWSLVALFLLKER